MSNRESMPKPEGTKPQASAPPAPPMAGEAAAPPKPDQNLGPAPVSNGEKVEASMKVAKDDDQGIMVTALYKGYYNNLRKKPGDKFLVSSFDKLGSWMQPDDKEVAAKLKAFLKEKRKKALAK